jgi:hypothetical protein
VTTRLGRLFDLALVVVLVGVGLALRVWLLRTPIGRLDADESVVALMGARIHHGAHPLFFWGQYYGGTLEVALVSLVQRVHRGVTAVKVVPMTLSAVAGGLTVWAARPLLDRRRAWLAGALVFAWPGTVWLATKERGFYWMTLVLVVGGLGLALRVARDDAAAHRGRVVALGVVAGLAWYESAQSAFVLVPVLVWLLVVTPRPRRRRVLPLAIGALVGAAPWLWELVRHGARLFQQPGPSSSYRERLWGFLVETIPRAAGLRGTYYGGVLLGPLGALALASAAVAVVVAVVRVLRAGPSHPWAPFAWTALAMPFLAAIPKATAITFEPRYALLLVPFAAIALGALARTRALATVIVAVAVLFGAANAHYVRSFSRDFPHALDLTPPDTTSLRAFLSATHVNRLYADYWVAYPLTEASHERIVASPLDTPRSTYHRALVQAARPRVWVVFAGSPRDRELPQLLARTGVEFQRTVVGDFAVYRFAEPQDPQRYGRFWSTTPAGY